MNSIGDQPTRVVKPSALSGLVLVKPFEGSSACRASWASGEANAPGTRLLIADVLAAYKSVQTIGVTVRQERRVPSPQFTRAKAADAAFLK
jgi:hypothetical protein